jgi:16S rRNA (cytosine1402-N4)-methyltransferase
MGSGQEFWHLPVMPMEVVRFLGCGPGGIYVDGTLGGGGHTLEILKATAPDGRVIGIDRDGDAIASAARFLEPYAERVLILKENFKEIKTVLARNNTRGIDRVDGIVLDLGVSSYQLEMPNRGFSFRFDARLDMRMDRTQELTAYELVNGLAPSELERILRAYGEERRARRIARAIERARAQKPVETTGELARIVLEAVPTRPGPTRVHPATKVFQALRIAVNDELENLKVGISEGLETLRRGGRMVVISFHSLEDRIVKHSFRDLSTGCVCPPRIPRCVCGLKPSVRLLTRRAVTPTPREIKTNPRARSARLRAVEKL